MAAKRATIDRLFAGDRVEDILQRLDAEEEGADREWAATTAATIRTKSPLSLKIALAQVRRGKDWSFEDCMTLRIPHRLAHRVRARLL